MSNIFRDSEFLGKNNTKKWSQNLKKKKLIKGVKVPSKKIFLSANLSVLLSSSVERSFVSRIQDFLKEN